MSNSISIDKLTVSGVMSLEKGKPVVKADVKYISKGYYQFLVIDEILIKEAVKLLISFRDDAVRKNPEIVFHTQGDLIAFTASRFSKIFHLNNAKFIPQRAHCSDTELLVL